MTNPGSTENKPVEILLVEDNPGDVTLMRGALKKSRFQVNMNVAADGDEALAYLRQQGRFSNAPLPNLILLDLNLPRVSGHEVLAEIKKDGALKHIPVLIMTSSKNNEDVDATYQNNASFYIIKPMELSHYAAIVSYIDDFWLQRVQNRPSSNAAAS